MFAISTTTTPQQHCSFRNVEKIICDVLTVLSNGVTIHNTNTLSGNLAVTRGKYFWTLNSVIGLLLELHAHTHHISCQQN